ncbi:hypothetical protein HH214_20170 [Mucilaginibacter robiniae]|uniref:Uncharacterized protein n=1 Tax=Mucilaginibacter robiniae TaxID=2728022 RepID=A0A7L5EC98_9SPHI|nr:hypothetical protein [Mucilaginibacter robiniae]QJD98026.1 hypothetical protein HH214_20170 [Mucilaginibacter robiniae]
MKKPISRQAHGAADYSYAAVVSVLPELLKFQDNKKATTLCRLLGGGALAYSLLTQAEWGLWRVLPFKKHLMIDLSVSLFALGAPWLLKFADDVKARNAVIATGLTGFTVGALTEQENM